MIHPSYRRRGLAKRLLREVDTMCPNQRKELYTCTKSKSNIDLYRKMGYMAYKTHTEIDGQTFVDMKKE